MPDLPQSTPQSTRRDRLNELDLDDPDMADEIAEQIGEPAAVNLSQGRSLARIATALESLAASAATREARESGT